MCEATAVYSVATWDAPLFGARRLIFYYDIFVLFLISSKCLADERSRRTPLVYYPIASEGQ